MPTISIFRGIAIRMNWSEHGPPHFHALYAEHMAVVDIRKAVIVRGSLPLREKAFVIEWARRHKEELLENWDRCVRGTHPKWIQPLR
jgi:hypothetical protein